MLLPTSHPQGIFTSRPIVTLYIPLFESPFCPITWLTAAPSIELFSGNAEDPKDFDGCGFAARISFSRPRYPPRILPVRAKRRLFSGFRWPSPVSQPASLRTLAVPFDWRTIGLARQTPPEKKARISPFLNFLGGGELKELVSDEDSTALQNWVIQTLAKEMRSVKNPSIATRRDLGLIAALCAAPAKGTPRKWPENCLKIDGHEVLLWETAIEEPRFAISLRFWQAWRERRRRSEMNPLVDFRRSRLLNSLINLRKNTP
jgi:hypothetical protein